MSLAEIHEVEILDEHLPSGLWHETWRRVRKDPMAIIGASFVALFIVMAVFAPWIAPYSPTEQDLSQLTHGCCPRPSLAHPMGLDELGRDELSRVIYGARYSLVIGVVSVAVGLSFGMLLGAIAGGIGGVTDSVVMRGMDIMLAIPGLLLAIGIVSLMGPGLVPVMIAVGVANIPIFSRLLRGTILGQRDSDYVLAARSIGLGRRRILTAHVLPNSISPVIVAGTLAMATAIIDVAGLGFLGLGPQDPSTPEWGTMLTNANLYLQTAPFLALFPGLAIVMVVLGFNLIGDGLREALDPKLRGRV